MRIFRLALALVAIGILLALAPSTEAVGTVDGHYQGFGDSAGFLNILPPGQDGTLNGLEAIQAQLGTYPPHVKDQLSMYGDLVYNTPGLTEAQLTDFFKDASFGVKADDIDRVYSPTTGVVVIRDKSFGVPHIFGDTRYATMFAQGYTGAEDRLFLMDALRHVGRGEASEFLGAAPSNIALDREQEQIAPYTEADLTNQLQNAIAASGPEGQAIYNDLLAYVDGVNQYIKEALLDPTKLPAEYPALQQVPMPWKAEDTVAIASLVGGIFGKGGGGELQNYCGLQTLTSNLGGDATQARTIFNDLHGANDPEAPTTASATFPYMTNLGSVNPSAVPNIDCSTLKPVDPDGGTTVGSVISAISTGTGVVNLQAPWGPIIMDFNDSMSNAVLISGARTQTGDPIAVFGPQTSYYMPQLLVEKDVHGPGIDARGAAFAGTDIYVELGRGRNYAWSATSASGDNIDTFVLKLCEPSGGTPTVSSMGYAHNGTCLPIETFQHTQVAKPSAGGVPSGPDVLLSWRIERTADYGPVAARGTLKDGTPIAVATLRSTYNNELGSARGFYRINNPDYMTAGYQSFRQAMSGVDYTFNWFYIDNKDIGYQASCRCPQRAQGVDPYMPNWGTGQFDWQGFLPSSAEPWDLNPSKGYLTSWNNKQALGWMAADNNFSYGPVYRSQMLDHQVQLKFAQGNLLDRADVVDVMEEAGTVDLRGQEDLPYILQLLGPTAPNWDPRLQDVLDRLKAWVAEGAHRRDHNHDGQYDDPQSPAIMDAWWPELVKAIFQPAGDAVTALGLTIDDPNRINHIGSAFQDGMYGQVNKDIRRALGQSEQGAYSRLFCGAGNVTNCRTDLWLSLDATLADLTTEFDSPNVADWKRQVADEDIRHTAVGVTSVPAIEWVNRPTFQQVVQINSLQPVAQGVGAGSLTNSAGKKIAFSFNVNAYASGLGDGKFALHDQGGNQKISVINITSAHSPAGAGCGTVPANAAHTFEFTGVGSFNGSNGRTVHVCVQDNGDPGAGLDRIHADCATCPYGTAAPYTTELLDTGNIKVTAPPPPATPPGQPSVVTLDPVLGAPTGPSTLTATVYDTNGQPLIGQTVTLAGLGALPVSAITNALGQAPIAVAPLQPTTIVATAGGVESNPVRIGP